VTPPTAPAVRFDVVLLREGRRGTYEDTLAVAGAVLMDAALAQVIEVTGRKTLGIDRRRVGVGPGEPPDALLEDLRRRVEAVKPDTPKGWYERIAVYGEDAVALELIEAGTVRALDVPFYKRAVRHRTLEVVDGAARDAALDRLRAVDTAEGVCAAIVLRETEFLGDFVKRKEARQIGKAADRALGQLPPAVKAIADTLRERREAQDRIGTYAD
jgi:hypothetical protein